jgi:hypothetical protein
MFMFPKAKQVPMNTNDTINRRIERETEARVKYYSLRDKKEIEKRIEELNNEWDVEKSLEVHAGALALGGALLGFLVNKRFLALPVIAAGFLVQHSIQGWTPPIAVYRRLGFRSRREIERERNALKAIRGDYKEASEEKDNLVKAELSLEAAE